MKKFRLNKGSILTFEQTEELAVNGKKIKVMPVFRWLIERGKAGKKV